MLMLGQSELNFCQREADRIIEHFTGKTVDWCSFIGVRIRDEKAAAVFVYETEDLEIPFSEIEQLYKTTFEEFKFREATPEELEAYEREIDELIP